MLRVVLAGAAMLVLPGQGIITIIFGLSILDLEIKHRAMRWILTRKKVEEALQRLRSKVGKPPLVMPES